MIALLLMSTSKLTNPFHEEVLHLRLDGVQELYLAVAVMVLEVDDHVHHYKHLRRKHVVRPASSFLQPQLKRLQRPATPSLKSLKHTFPSSF